MNLPSSSTSPLYQQAYAFEHENHTLFEPIRCPRIRSEDSGDTLSNAPIASRATNNYNLARNVAQDFFHNSTDLPEVTAPTQTHTDVQTFLTRQRRVFCESELAYIDNLFLSLKVGTHNINGLKVNPHKLSTLLEFIQNEQVDIFTLSNTNLSTYGGLFAMHQKFKESYKIFWTGKVDTKVKGSGIAMIVNNK